MCAAALDTQLRQWARNTPGAVFLSGSVQMTFAEVDAEVEARAQRLADQCRGGSLLLAGCNDLPWVLNLMGALRSRLPVVIVPHGLMALEEAKITELAGATLRAEKDVWRATNIETALRLRADWEASGAALAFSTSGSTGQPRLALRSDASLVAEGERYRTLLQITSRDIIAGSLPLSHAYAFGAAFASALVAGATLVLDEFLSPRRLARLVTNKRITIWPLVGSLARSLGQLDGGQPVESKLKIAMVGGGIVTQEMSDVFEAKWGLPLSQNYGSSEIGALLASFAPYATKGTGFPMMGVECRLSKAIDGTSELWVRTPAQPVGYMTASGFEAARLSPDGWWATGDLFGHDESGLYTMMGRLGQQIRRGGKTIHPREIERTLLRHAAVDEALVTGSKELDGDECVEAHIVLKQGATASISELRDHMLALVAPHKCPTRWHIHDEFARTWSNKPAVKQRGQVEEKNGSAIFNALISHRLTTAIVAAEAAGLLDELAKEPATVEQIAQALKLKTEPLNLFLRFLAALGVVFQNADKFTLVERKNKWWKPAIALEASLQKTWLTADAVGDVLRLGFDRRPFNQPRTDGEFDCLYRDAMCGQTHVSVVQQVLRRFKPNQDAARILEIGRGIGILSKWARQKLASPETELVALTPAPALIFEEECQVNPANLKLVQSWTDIIPEAARFHLIFVMNGIHWLKPAEAKTVFQRLLAGLAPNGLLMIADMFLSGGDVISSAPKVPWIFLLDWMTHGGTNFLTVDEVVEQLVEAGAGKVEQHPLANLPFEVIEVSR